MVRGIWLDHSTLDSIRAELREIYGKAGADETLDHPQPEQIDQLLAGMEKLGADGWIFNDHQLEQLSGMLRDIGRAADAGPILALSSSNEK